MMVNARVVKIIALVLGLILIGVFGTAWLINRNLLNFAKPSPTTEPADNPLFPAGEVNPPLTAPLPPPPPPPGGGGGGARPGSSPPPPPPF